MRAKNSLLTGVPAFLTCCALLWGCAGPTGPAGVPCTVDTASDGTVTVSCPDGSKATVKSGTNGSNGTNGTNGSNGTNGLSCSVSQNADAGTKTIHCSDGTSVVVIDGQNGAAGQPVEVLISAKHGIEAVAAEALAVEQKTWVKVTATGATANAAGEATVTFTVLDAANRPYAGVTAVSATIAKLIDAPAGEASTRWVPYLYTTQTVTSAGAWPGAIGTTAYQATRESNGTLTNHGDGTYTYAFHTNLTAAAFPDGGAAIAYERNRTHRVSVMLGGHTGATGSAEFDFVPDGSALTQRRDIVATATCQKCHGATFAAHGGDRMTVGNCTTCHEPVGADPHSGNTLDFTSLIHKIHAGSELPSIAGPDGIVWDNPATPVDESADNGQYAFWGYLNTKADWWKVGFPAVLANCTACHTGAGAQVDNWKAAPSRRACGSCHDNVNFATGVNHAGGSATTDGSCALCHPASGAIAGFINPVPAAHDFSARDLRNVPEFLPTLTVSTPGNGSFFVAGERPRVTIQLAWADGGTIDHRTLDAGATAVGCGGLQTDGGWDGTCSTVADGFLASANFFVHGPRADQNPVLTTVARAEVISQPDAGTTWSFDAGTALALKVDNGQDVRVVQANGQDKVFASVISVAVPAGGFTNADQTTLMNWLNGVDAFRGRAVAYLDERTGRLAIRSRNLGKVYAVQLQAGPVTSAVFNGNTTMQVVGGSTASNNFITDVKSTVFADRIEYELDPVDDLRPGTYVAQVEVTDRGRISAVVYKTPSVKWVAFQVKQAEIEKPVAAACDSCHQSPSGKGLVLDPSRHNKQLGNDAPDQCAGCHDKQVQSAIGGWSGAGALTRRVHAVHAGAALNFPLITVGYANGDPVAGRNWDITFPQDLRNCQACHAANTSAQWKSTATRLACGGCHDSTPAVAHMQAMTFDPTPTDIYSGDEQESCNVCHAP